MATVFDVANFFIDMAVKVDHAPLSNLKLNKLLYFAQGCYLSRTGHSLFSDAIEAWEHGPVVPAIYHKYKIYGRNSIMSVDGSYTHAAFSDEELESLIDVATYMGALTSSDLVSKTHDAGTPWRKMYDGQNAVLPLWLIKTYFAEHPVPTFSAPTDGVEVLPAEWYDPEEDNYWENFQCATRDGMS